MPTPMRKPKLALPRRLPKSKQQLTALTLTNMNMKVLPLLLIGKIVFSRKKERIKRPILILIFFRENEFLLLIGPFHQQ